MEKATIFPFPLMSKSFVLPTLARRVQVCCIDLIFLFCGFYLIQAGASSGLGLRPLNSPNSASGIGSYDQLIQQYQQHQNQPQFRLQQMSAIGQPYRDQGMKSLQPQVTPDPYGLLGLLSVIRMSDPNLTSLALGIDLTTLGLNLNSADNLHKTFGSPWSDEPAKGDPEFNVPQCYYAKQPPPLNVSYLYISDIN